MADAQEDLFNDAPTSATKGEGDSKEFDDTKGADNQKPADKAVDGKQVADTGAKDNADGTPPEDKEGDKGAADGKMIPEHRFKAALKDIQDKLDAVMQENATLKAVPTPDKEKDPKGYELHVRMEASKAVMLEFKTDYNEVIQHYIEMAKANPYLNDKVAEHPLPAKFAYDLAKKDMELKELAATKDSPEYKEFLESKKQKAAEAEAAAKAAEAGGQTDAGKQVAAALISKVPNLNRATDVSKGATKADEAEELFQGAL